MDNTSFAEILPCIGIRHSLIYRNSPKLQIGSLVKIPVRGKTYLGLVKALDVQANKSCWQYQTVDDVIYDKPVVGPDLIALMEWFIAYYACTYTSAFETFLPNFIRQGKIPSPTYGLRVTTVEASFRKNSFQQQQIYTWIQAHPNIPYDDFIKQFPRSSQTLNTLINKQYVDKVPLTEAPARHSVTTQAIQLTDEQSKIVQSISNGLNEGYKTHVILGVTGSGKTEIYNQVIFNAQQRGLQALYLVPEIALTEQALEKIYARLGSDRIRVALWHSNLDDKERMATWWKVLNNEIDVILGTRSALFLPLQHMGLIVVDEEHEPAYKQTDNPRYHGRDLAVYRALLNRATCLLGSATPSTETWANVQNGKYQLHELTQRPHRCCLPKVHVVDMSYEKPNFEGSFILSTLLQEKLRERLDRKEQSILFLNRRGYAPYLRCSECNQRVTCPYCHANLIYHQQSLKCHLCHHTLPLLTKCSHCGGKLIKSRGLGTQRIEAYLQKFYPQARVLRLDTDVADRSVDWYTDMQNHCYDILVGTQMIAKGLDFPNVTLVGLIQADGQLNINDFRAAERTFQLIVQASGRAGRSEQAGEVILQSFSPQASCIQFGINGQVKDFLNAECQLRRQYNYPPYRHLIRQILRSRSEDKLRYTCSQWSSFLQQNLRDTPIEILGPAIPTVGKINNYYRQHALFFTSNVLRDLATLLQLQKQFKWPPNIIDLWDVDPVDFT